jgi:tetratricopeptide (TPR) repeat protein
VVLRGAEDRAHEVFRLAMQDYMKGDYSAAIPGLRNAVNASPRTAGYQFYLGASYLLTSQFEPAVDALGKAATLDDTAYTEPAHFYLAKAYLNVGNVSAAEAELQTTVRLGGGYEAQARAILHQLR